MSFFFGSRRIGLVMVAILALAACGGGGGSGSPTPAGNLPAIVTQPANQSVVVGEAATFRVSATGSGLAYQWQTSAMSAGAFTNIVGATSASYTTPAATSAADGSAFRVVVTNSAGSVTSQTAVLTVTSTPIGPTIGSQPASVSVTAPATASFSVTAMGTPTPTYQWQVSQNGGNSFSNLPGAVASTYLTPPTTVADNGWQYRVVVTNSQGSVTSNVATLTVDAAPAVTVAISTASSTVLPGQAIVFTVTEANSATSVDAGHNVYATVPAYTTVAQADVSSATANTTGCSSGSWPCLAGQQVYWGIQTSAQQSQSMQFAATVSASSPPSAGTILSSEASTSLSGSGTASARVVAASTPGLELAMDTPQSVVAPGATLTYTLSYANASGNSVAANLLVPVPTGTIFVSATGSGALVGNGGSVQWSLGSVGAGATGQVEMTVQIASPVVGSPLISAEAQLVDATTAVLAQASNTVQAIANPTQLTITATGGPVQPGQSIVYTVSEYFTGNAYNAGHTIYATVPAYTSVSQADVSSGTANTTGCSSGSWPCLAGQQIYRGVQTTSQQTQSMQFSATVSTSSPPPTGTLLNSSVTAGDAVTGFSGAGTASTTVVTAGSPGLQLAIDPAASVVVPGGTLAYTLTYSNTSGTSLPATLLVALPPGVSFVSATDDGSFDSGSGSVQWNLGAIGAGAAGQAELTVQVASPVVGSPLISTSAQLVSPTNFALLLAQSSATVEATADPTQLAITAAAGPVRPGQAIVFTVTEAYTGGSYNAGHLVYATVPAYTTVAQADVSVGTFSSGCSSGSWPCVAGQQIYWDIQTDAQQSQSMQFAATVSASGPPPAGTILRSVATAGNAVTGFSGAGTASSSVVAESTPGLELALDAPTSVVAPGGTLTYVITYANASGTAISANLLAQLPVGVMYVSATNSGTLNSATGTAQWTLGTISAGASGQVDLTVQVASPLDGSPILIANAQLVTPGSSPMLLAQASNTVQAIADATQLAIAATPGAGGINYTISEHYSASSGVNGANYVYVTVPAFSSVAQSSTSTTCTSGYCSTASCSSGSWPCEAGQQVSWQIQTDASQTQLMNFTATVSTTNPPPSGSILSAQVTANQSGIGSTSVSAIAP